MIHAFFVTIGVLAAILLFPYIVVLTAAILLNRIFWFSVFGLFAFWLLFCFFGVGVFPIVGVPFFLWCLIKSVAGKQRERLNTIQAVQQCGREKHARVKDWDRTIIYDLISKPEINLADKLGDVIFKDS